LAKSARPSIYLLRITNRSVVFAITTPTITGDEDNYSVRSIGAGGGFQF
jgi:hypothetical protein